MSSDGGEKRGAGKKRAMLEEGVGDIVVEETRTGERAFLSFETTTTTRDDMNNEHKQRKKDWNITTLVMKKGYSMICVFGEGERGPANRERRDEKEKKER